MTPITNPANQPKPHQWPIKRKRGPNLPVQLKYAALLSTASGFVNLVMIFVMAWFIQRNYSLFMADELGVSAQVIEMVRNEQQMLEISLFILFLFSISVMFTASFLVTRKLIGPIAALKRHLQLFARGEWSRTFRLRKNDEFKELEKIVNNIRETHLAEISGKKNAS
ncbi:MAG: methyl-accepting chemotaxis protein [Bdellovibrionaceae bacterium]|nr:methyl-accepting chemotaxis protein [Bdellovibrionales bacterium]MCB9254289.1 methyl-accepting chemotaxis protein [Pseudobdellovibrionaceae bacterium]